MPVFFREGGGKDTMPHGVLYGWFLRHRATSNSGVIYSLLLLSSWPIAWTLIILAGMFLYGKIFFILLKVGSFSVQLFSHRVRNRNMNCADTSGGTITGCAGCAGGWTWGVQVLGVQRAAPVCSHLINDRRAPWEEKPEVTHETQTCSSQLMVTWAGCSWCYPQNASTLQGLKLGPQIPLW